MVDAGIVRHVMNTDFQSFQVCRFRIRIYSEGVVSHSPGLRAKRATLEKRFNRPMYPNGVPPSAFLKGCNPFRVDRLGGLSPRVARVRGHPWAMWRYSFGVKTAPFNAKFGTTVVSMTHVWRARSRPVRHSMLSAWPPHN